MNKIVKEYLKEAKEKELKNRKAFLIKEGLYEDIYSNKTEFDEEFPLKDIDKGYYKRVVPELNDDEFALILKAKGSSAIDKNNMASIITFLAYLFFIIFLIAGIAIAILTEKDSFLIFATYFIMGLISCIFTLVYAEILKLLQKVVNQTRKWLFIYKQSYIIK